MAKKSRQNEECFELKNVHSVEFELKNYFATNSRVEALNFCFDSNSSICQCSTEKKYSRQGLGRPQTRNIPRAPSKHKVNTLTRAILTT